MSVAAFLGSLCFACLIVSAIEGEDPKKLLNQTNDVVIIIAASILSGFITYQTQLLTGVITGVSIATFGATVNVHTTRPHYLAAYVLGFVGGALYQYYPKAILGLFILGGLLATLWSHFDCVLVGLLAFALIKLILYSVEELSSKLSLPIYLYINKSNFLLLMSFFIGYMLIIIFFALVYSAAYHWSPKEAFYSSLPEERLPTMNFGVFVYFSVITIGTIGYGDIVPSNSFTRWIVGIESLAGMTWIVIYFSLLMKKLSE